jgi:D-3-phosphoglycerate dehydrogenase / 2-oxoglutarate reductase
MNILIADAVSPAAVDVLRAQADWNVIVSSPKEFEAHLAEADALLIRSAVKVTSEILEKAPKLRVIGRAGVGVDNVDQESATTRGVVVMNTPGGNAISVAEHTLALMLALARSVSNASTSTKSGKWEKKKFLGTELNGKTLGVIGLGNIGMQVARRARSFGMTLVACDPFVSPQLAKDLGVEMVDLERLYASSDYISLHLAVTDETKNLLNREAFAKMKDGVRIVNCARGELLDEAALEEALNSGKVAGAALDVFAQEPPHGSPLLRHENVIATPHIGGSTEEAQEAIGIRIAEQVRDYLRDGVVLNAVNMPAITAEQYGQLQPYLELAERLGSFVAQIATGRPNRVRIVYSGNFGEANSSLIRNAALSGILNRFLSEKANLINAAQIAARRDFGVNEIRQGRLHFSDSLTLALETAEGERMVEGTVFPDGKPRLLSVDGIYVEAALTGHLVFMKNDDVPGVIGRVGSILGANSINIAGFSLGRPNDPPPDGSPVVAIAVVRIDDALPKKVLDELLAMEPVRFSRAVELLG